MKPNIIIVSRILCSNGEADIDIKGAIVDFRLYPGGEDVFSEVERYDIEEYMLFWGVKDVSKIGDIDILEIGGINKDGTTFEVESSHIDMIMLPERHLVVKCRDDHKLVTDHSNNVICYNDYSEYLEGLKKGLHNNKFHYVQNIKRDTTKYRC